MERHSLFDTEIHKERERLMLLRDFQIYMIISSTFENLFLRRYTAIMNFNCSF